MDPTTTIFFTSIFLNWVKLSMLVKWVWGAAEIYTYWIPHHAVLFDWLWICLALWILLIYLFPDSHSLLPVVVSPQDDEFYNAKWLGGLWQQTPKFCPPPFYFKLLSLPMEPHQKDSTISGGEEKGCLIQRCISLPVLCPQTWIRAVKSYYWLCRSDAENTVYLQWLLQ